MDRREFCTLAVALTTARTVSRAAGTRLILLGTAGGPRPRQSRAASAQVVITNGRAFVVDCGDGVARQLVLAGIPLASIRHIFITHHHSDHNADYGNLLLLSWAAGLRSRIDCWGPTPLRRMTELFLKLSAPDINARVADEARVPLAPLVHAHDLDRGGPVMQDDQVRVTAAAVHHPPFKTAFAYRFDAPDRSITISGDTTPSEALVELAQGTDVLVHEALYPAGIDRLVAGVPNALDLKRSILSHHTTAEEAGRIAKAAGAKTLVLSHLVPAEDPLISDQMWLDAARSQFAGQIIVGRDLLEL